MANLKKNPNPPWKGKLVNSVIFKLERTLGVVKPESIFEGLTKSFPNDVSNIIAMYQLGGSRTWGIDFNEQTKSHELIGKTFIVQLEQSGKTAEITCLDPDEPEQTTFVIRIHYLPAFVGDDTVRKLFENRFPNGFKVLESVRESFATGINALNKISNGVRRLKIAVAKSDRQLVLDMVGKWCFSNHECQLSILGYPKCFGCDQFGHLRRDCQSKNGKPSFSTVTRSGRRNAGVEEEEDIQVDGVPPLQVSIQQQITLNSSTSGQNTVGSIPSDQVQTDGTIVDSASTALQSSAQLQLTPSSMIPPQQAVESTSSGQVPTDGTTAESSKSTTTNAPRTKTSGKQSKRKQRNDTSPQNDNSKKPNLESSKSRSSSEMSDKSDDDDDVDADEEGNEEMDDIGIEGGTETNNNGTNELPDLADIPVTSETIRLMKSINQQTS